MVKMIITILTCLQLNENENCTIVSMIAHPWTKVAEQLLQRKWIGRKFLRQKSMKVSEKKINGMVPCFLMYLWYVSRLFTHFLSTAVNERHEIGYGWSDNLPFLECVAGKLLPVTVTRVVKYQRLSTAQLPTICYCLDNKSFLTLTLFTSYQLWWYSRFLK